MYIIHDINEWRAIRGQLSSEVSLGFVPTMGNLHQGHASLFKRSILENDITLASIFINPTQFDRKEDFAHYPKTLEADFELLKQIGVNYCFLPKEEDLYADGYRFQLHETEKSLCMEGKHRPGHFNGVLTVVMKLFNIAKPHRAYFGEKDYQQFELIQEMAQAFMLDIEVKSCPTIREMSGLAYSSRNNRLTANERLLAEQFASIFRQTKNIPKAIQKLTDLNIKVEYIEEHDKRRYAAVFVGNIRLIDNYCINC